MKIILISKIRNNMNKINKINHFFLIVFSTLLIASTHIAAAGSSFISFSKNKFFN